MQAIAVGRVSKAQSKQPPFQVWLKILVGVEPPGNGAPRGRPHQRHLEFAL